MRLKMSDDGYVMSLSDTCEELFGLIASEARSNAHSNTHSNTPFEHPFEHG